jgi:hypothetical protein
MTINGCASPTQRHAAAGDARTKGEGAHCWRALRLPEARPCFLPFACTWGAHAAGRGVSAEAPSAVRAAGHTRCVRLVARPRALSAATHLQALRSGGHRPRGGAAQRAGASEAGGAASPTATELVAQTRGRKREAARVAHGAAALRQPRPRLRRAAPRAHRALRPLGAGFAQNPKAPKSRAAIVQALRARCEARAGCAAASAHRCRA